MAVTIPRSYKDSDLIRLERKLKASHEPIFVDVVPEDWALLSECYPNVERKVKESGGRMVLGWQVWKTRHLIEGEMHAVWESPEEELIDITPKDPSFSQIMFIEDENLTYSGVQVDNVRLNITSNKIVDDFIAIAEALYQFDNKGQRAQQYVMALTPAENAQRKELETLKDMAYSLMHYGQNRQSPCACGSPIAWADCHGDNLAKKLATLTA